VAAGSDVGRRTPRRRTPRRLTEGARAKQKGAVHTGPLSFWLERIAETAPEIKVFLLLFLQKKKSLFFFEKKNQKTFASLAWG
jgi:hypothetical protein